MMLLSELEPKSVWSYFDQICKVPRPSKREEKIIAFLIEFAQNNQLSWKRDEVGNVLIVKSASAGYENHPKIVLQSHLDMVCEKNEETIHNFDTDPIVPRVDGEWVKATGTTLGADCGIGIATQMAILTSNEIQHGPLECLFTVDEETGLTGAKALKPGFFEGKILINLDSEDEGELFIGCAGGVDTVAQFRAASLDAPQGYLPIRIAITGLLGGHSGDDINKNRSNAIKLLVRCIHHLSGQFECYLCDLRGGNLRNAIAREASAEILVPFALKEQVTVAFNLFRCEIENEILLDEPNVHLSLGSCEYPQRVFMKKDAARLIDALYACPHGVMRMSTKMPGMVETSTNLASVKAIEPFVYQITTSQRSDLESGKSDVAACVGSVFNLLEADVSHGDGYPGWAPNPQSRVLALTRQAYIDLFGVEPVVRSIHAGLECGLFSETFPGLDMISFGPTLRGVHSPDERINIETVGKFWTLLIEVLKRS